MNKFVKLSVMLALLASGACKADESGLCKPLCDQEKRQCRTAATNLVDQDTESLMARRAGDAPVRYFGDTSVHTSNPAGPDVQNAQDRRMRRTRACDDRFAVCRKACSAETPSSDVLIKRPR